MADGAAEKEAKEEHIKNEGASGYMYENTGQSKNVIHKIDIAWWHGHSFALLRTGSARDRATAGVAMPQDR